MRAWLLVALLVPRLAGQVFEDAEFDFRFTPPPGMRQLAEAELAAARNVPIEEVRNRTREEAGDETLIHSYVWIDTSTPYARQIELQLRDGPLPYRGLKEFSDAAKANGIDVETQRLLEEPTFLVEGTFTNPAGTRMRKRLLYLIDSRRFGVLNLQANDADWIIIGDEITQVQDSIVFDRDLVREYQAVQAAQTSVRGKVVPGTGRDPDQWTSLPVLGSLVLALVFALVLLFGPRG